MEAGLDMIMVDYLQLTGGKGKVESRQQEISQISRGLKAIAKGSTFRPCAVAAPPP
jgi:replicative DNA helicase